MNSYEKLLDEADINNIEVIEAPLQAADGLCVGNHIAIRSDIPTTRQKADVLAEELGHYRYTVGDISDQKSINDIKQENYARLYAYNLRIGLNGLIKASKNGCKTAYDTAEYLDVSENFLLEALERYRQRYGTGTMVDNYFIQFEPYLQVYTYQLIE